jgi:hypothetical protein
MKQKTVVSLDQKELSFILEACRYWQRDMDQPGFESALTEAQIDDLCERINCGNPEIGNSLRDMTANLIETHFEEYTTKHAGDAKRKGEAPDNCSYCADVVNARSVLKHLGINTKELRP